MEQITGAGNTEVPAYLALLHEGFRVECQAISREKELWVAERSDLRLSGESPLEVLGLYYMRQQRGQDWKAEDSEIDAFLSRFYPAGEPDCAMRRTLDLNAALRASAFEDDGN